MDDNREITQAFLDSLAFHPNEGSPERELAQMHHICRDIPLVEIVGRLLVPYRFTAPGDTQEITGVLLQLSHALEQNQGERCVVYRMSPDYTRRRTVDANGRIRNLFQGAAPVNPPELRGSIYPGDREIRESEDVTVQVHFVDITQNSELVAENVPVIAVWIPGRMELAWLTQEQP
jgi:hypothetical protein